MGNNQRRRVVLTLGAAAGGLLAAAFLPTAVAFADEYGPEDLTSTALIAPNNFLMEGATQVDLANFGDGWENEWI